MAVYRVTSPDGAIYEVTAPDDADEQEVLARAQAFHAQTAAAGPAPPAASGGPGSAPVLGAWPSGNTVLFQYGDGTYQTRTGGDPNWRNNNPGNMVYGPASRASGAVGTDPQTPNGFAIFPDEAAGFRAVINDLKSPQYQAMTIGQAIRTWAPPNDNNTAAYQAFVSHALGLPIETPMNRLSPQQLDSMGRAIQHFEGQAQGTALYWPAPY
ncbi:MAG TPA: hypothetical protein VFW28_01235 [Micropepsaceae bacterium]|nr:hypothetical protein [Micropepsaceae bacterium]